MQALKDMPISFPGLFGDWEWDPDPIAVHIGHGIYWYGIILAAAMLCGMRLAMRRAERSGLTEDHISDLVLWAVPCCILGSRIYYVVFYQDLYRDADGTFDWARAAAIWDGGIAMYGTVIAGFLAAFLFARIRKIPMGALTDAAVPGLLLGQAIGRWANLINREAFGAPTDLPWRMRVWISHTRSIEVHPTFLYESLWNFAGLLLLLTVVTAGRRFDGENTWFYLLWYGVGRFWIEGLRMDSLYLFDWTVFGARIRVSQALSLAIAVLAAWMLFYELKIRKRTPEGLYVHKIAAAGGPVDAPGDAAPVPDAGTGEAGTGAVSEGDAAPDAGSVPEGDAAPDAGSVSEGDAPEESGGDRS